MKGTMFIDWTHMVADRVTVRLALFKANGIIHEHVLFNPYKNLCGLTVVINHNMLVFVRSKASLPKWRTTSLKDPINLIIKKIVF